MPDATRLRDAGLLVHVDRGVWRLPCDLDTICRIVRIEFALVLSRPFPLDIHCDAMYSGAMLAKELVAASTEPMILSLLARGESYGYALIQEVKRLSKDRIEWTDGMLYPVLHRMEERGLIKSRWGKSETGRKRKYYLLKKDGRKAANRHLEQWSLVHSVLAGLQKEQYV